MAFVTSMVAHLPASDPPAVLQLQKVKASDAEIRDGLGSGVAVQATTLVFGAMRADHEGMYSDDGSVYVCQLVGTKWAEEAQLVYDPPSENWFGVEVDIDGNTIAAISTSNVTVWTPNGSWSEQEDSAMTNVSFHTLPSRPKRYAAPASTRSGHVRRVLGQGRRVRPGASESRKDGQAAG